MTLWEVSLSLLWCRVDESHLTGESEEVSKQPNHDPMMCSGSKMLEGDARILVTAVGKNSQQGVIAGLVQGGEEDDAMRQARAQVVAISQKVVTVET